MAVLEELTLKEKEAYNELKSRISNELTSEMRNDPNLYLRFLRARDFNVNAAENMLRNHITWRKANQTDSILTTYVPDEVMLKYFPLSTIGFDRDGCPVNYLPFGSTDTKGILKVCKTSAAVKGVVHFFEQNLVEMKKQSEKLNKQIYQWVFIFDLGHYNFAKATHKPTLETVVELFMSYEANYPERLKAAYIINASVYFSLLFAIIKPLLSGNTMKKLQFYGKNDWREELCKIMDPEELPVFLGGKKTDPDGDPSCKSFVKHAALVPEDLYKSRSTHRLCNEPGVKKITVSRMSKVPMELEIKEHGSKIEWEFETECRDIGFGLFFKEFDDDSATLELIPRQRIDTNISSEVGMFVCKKPGKYILMFDNSYSWIYQKEIYCKAKVVEPEKSDV